MTSREDLWVAIRLYAQHLRQHGATGADRQRIDAAIDALLAAHVREVLGSPEVLEALAEYAGLPEDERERCDEDEARRILAIIAAHVGAKP